jgi:hypothetical protein
MNDAHEIRTDLLAVVICPYCFVPCAPGTVVCPSCGEPIDLDGSISEFKEMLKGAKRRGISYGKLFLTSTELNFHFLSQT